MLEKFVSINSSLTFAIRLKKTGQFLTKRIDFHNQTGKYFLKKVDQKFGRNKKALTFALPIENGVAKKAKRSLKVGKQ